MFALLRDNRSVEGAPKRSFGRDANFVLDYEEGFNQSGAVLVLGDGSCFSNGSEVAGLRRLNHLTMSTG
jgi:hypothetical protein